MTPTLYFKSLSIVAQQVLTREFRPAYVSQGCARGRKIFSSFTSNLQVIFRATLLIRQQFYFGLWTGYFLNEAQ